MTAAATRVFERRRITVRGVVQGVGFRPFVARLAGELALSGHVGNDDISVFIEVEGPGSALVEFLRRLRDDAPPLARVAMVDSVTIAATGHEGFEIVESRHEPGLRTLVPADTATCDSCSREMLDPADRRYRHPFITCTDCGPRFTIITDLPYDRPATTMAPFPMCDACRAEYEDPDDRRYHAQPVACHDCGPRLWAQDASGEVASGERAGRVDSADAAIARAQEVLVNGGIVAIKGIGGFHLACDAANGDAVATLRQRKGRPDKPFALMAADLAAAHTLIQLDATGAAVLSGPARPIVLAATAAGAPVAPGVAPGLDELGVMLAYAPVHQLLFAAGPGGPAEVPQVLVMTSGNLSDEPLAFTNGDALARLGDIADLFLLHDRDIAVPCEDSVVTIRDGFEVPVRRSRGFAPLPVWLDGADDAPAVLAVGGEIKNTFSVTRGGLAFMSAHLGEMGSLESMAAFDRSVAQLLALHGVEPAVIAADDHPGYNTRAWAERRAERDGLPVVTVQHHHAHFASLLAEHGRQNLTDGPVVGIVLDGTGYGCDKTVWGGEILLCDGDIAHAERVGHLEPFALPGGDAAVRNPFRVALSLLHLAGIDESGLDLADAIDVAERQIVHTMLATGTGCVTTSSAGRLFDGVSSLLGVKHRISYEAQAAIELEAVAHAATESAELSTTVEDGVVRLGPLVRGIVDALHAGADRAAIARGFHEALAEALAESALAACASHHGRTVGLTGGVFANRMLTEALTHRLARAGVECITHRVVPCNDGGLALGQAVVAHARNRRGEN